MAGKYGRLEGRMTPKPRPWKVHPIWQGIGCIMMIIIPIISYAGAQLLVEGTKDVASIPHPWELMKPVTLPVNTFSAGQLADIAVDHLYANLLVAVALVVIGYALLMILYTIIYSVIGPSRFGPLDARPIHSKNKRRY